MEATARTLTAEKLLAMLIDLYADQMGVKIKYEIEERKDDAWEL